MLNDRSKLVDTTPEKIVYRYINIWIGKAGFATTSNIHDPVIRFSVNSSWIKQTGAAPEDIRLLRFNETAWETLPTHVQSNGTEYVMLESQTPGFSPFAIVAEKTVETVVVPSVTIDIDPVLVQTEQQTENTYQKRIYTEKSNVCIFFLILLLAGVFAVGSEYLKKEDN